VALIGSSIITLASSACTYSTFIHTITVTIVGISRAQGHALDSLLPFQNFKNLARADCGVATSIPWSGFRGLGVEGLVNHTLVSGTVLKAEIFRYIADESQCKAQKSRTRTRTRTRTRRRISENR
jgi:uncharacterized membrane protein (DUF441 family)